MSIAIDEIQKYELPTPRFNPIEYMTDEHLMQEEGNPFLFDIECFPNYFLIAMKSFVTGRVLMFERSADYGLEFDNAKVRWIVENMLLVGFNSKGYDLPMLWASLHGLWATRLHEMSNALILGGMKAYETEREFKYRIGFSNDIDLQQVAPSAAAYCSLKHYGGRMHVEKLQDLPINALEPLSPNEVDLIRFYCVNDLDITGWLNFRLKKAIELREEMGLNYGTDLRSLSDAQIAEKVIANELAAVTGITVSRPSIQAGTAFQYQPPDYMQFYTPALQKLFERIKETMFVVDGLGKVQVEEKGELKSAKNLWTVPIGESVYRLGIGGLHSSEKCASHWSDQQGLLIDRDVASYYPAIILNQQLYPKHIGPDFLEVYGDIVSRRLRAKRDGDKTTADSLKICINGCFGKFGSEWSRFYAPDLLIQVTLTGQLSLLMLIEMIEWVGIPVVSANTDGIVMKCPQSKHSIYEQTVKAWEQITGFTTEETLYHSLHSRDVNNYIAIGADGSIKAKGSYVNELSMKEPNREMLMKNPNGTICSEAVMKFLASYRGPHPVTIEQTVMGCKDLTKFLFVRRVNGGAVKDKQYLGKIVRWYMRKDEYGAIKYLKPNRSGSINKVSETDGSYPIMDLRDVPNDIDYDWYIRKAHSILKDVGFWGSGKKQQTLF